MENEGLPQQEIFIQDPVVKKSLEIASSSIQQIAPIRFPEVDPAEILSRPDGPRGRVDSRGLGKERRARSEKAEWGEREFKLDFFRKRQQLIENLLDPVVTEEEVAMLLCSDVDKVKKWEGVGKITAFKKTPSHLFFRLSSVLHFLEKAKEVDEVE